MEKSYFERFAFWTVEYIYHINMLFYAQRGLTLHLSEYSNKKISTFDTQL